MEKAWAQWVKDNGVELSAVVLSVIAVSVSTLTWFSDRGGERSNRTADMCWSYHVGEELSAAKQKIREGDDPGNRALGDLYNALNIASRSMIAGSLDTDFALDCFKVEYVEYCKTVNDLGRAPKSNWESINAVIKDAKYWDDNNIPDVCIAASKLLG